MSSIKPLHDRIIIEPSAVEETTLGGIIIPDTAKEKPQEGTVIAIGDGKVSDSGNLILPVVKVGNKVMYAKFGGTEIKVDGKNMLLMRESDIFAILN
jgi:chaperonin GroES